MGGESNILEVRFYGSLGDRLGREAAVAAPKACTLSDLRALLIKAHPEAAEDLDSRSARACAGDRMIGEDHSLRAGETVEFLPPLSGG